jgi:hypothetical protein
MSLSNFPSIESSYSLIKTPTFDTKIINYGNKSEQRISLNDDPQYKLKLTFSNLSISDADLLQAFFITCKGRYTAFYLTSPDESNRSAIWTPNTAYILNQIIRPITTNTHSYKCTIAGTSHISTEPTFPTTVNTTVVDNGTLTWKENTLTVRFAEDTLNMDYFQYNLYDLGQIEFIEVNA